MNKNDKVAGMQKMSSGLQLNFAGRTWTLGNVLYKTEDIIKLLQGQVTEIQANDDAKASWLKGVAQQKDAYTTNVVPVVDMLRHAILAQYGASSTQYTSLGFPTPRKTKPTVKTKAAAQEQAAATRVARSTRGKKQKLAIKGAAKAPASGAAATPTASK